VDYPLLNLILLNCLLALSQFIVLRAGVFSVATAGLTACGAYTAALLVVKLSVPAPVAIICGVLAGAGFGLLLAIPLARVRGVVTAIATLAFVVIVQAACLNATPITGGAAGLNGIPKLLNTPTLVILVGLVVYLIFNLNRSGLGRAFETIRQDETVAVSFGIPVARLHALAFGLSGAVAGLGGGLMAFHNYSLVPEEFGFGMLVNLLAAVVIGGGSSVWGPLVGATFLTALPEVARPLAENRAIITGVLLMASIVYLPLGLVDTIFLAMRRGRAAKLNQSEAAKRRLPAKEQA
jgi:branched-chain amino acid transport system permease protein